jgi:hypothetical protein
MKLALECLEEKVNDMVGKMKCGCQLCLMNMAREVKLCGKN